MRNASTVAPLVVLCSLVVAVQAAWAVWAPDGVPLTNAAGAQLIPQLISDDAGGAIVTWQDQRVGVWDVFAIRIGPDGSRLWNVDGLEICTAGGQQTWPQLATDGAHGSVSTSDGFHREDPCHTCSPQRTTGLEQDAVEFMHDRTIARLRAARGTTRPIVRKVTRLSDLAGIHFTGERGAPGNRGWRRQFPTASPRARLPNLRRLTSPGARPQAEGSPTG